MRPLCKNWQFIPIFAMQLIIQILPVTMWGKIQIIFSEQEIHSAGYPNAISLNAVIKISYDSRSFKVKGHGAI